MEILDTSTLTPHEKAVLGHLYHQRQTLLRISRQLFNVANPVDEWSGAGVPDDGIIRMQPDYELPERITNVIVSLPVGATGCTLTLGERTIVLYSGAATTSQTLISLPFSGLILGRNDTRTLTITGVCTTNYYVNLSGHALERDGDR